MPVNRHYSSVAKETTLTFGVSASAGTITVGDLAGWPVQTPFTAVIDPGEPNEEIVTVTSVGGLTLYVERGEDGSMAIEHSAGAIVRHMMTGRDLREPQEHMAAATGVHGLGPGSAVVGTTDEQVLTNKTINAAANTITGLQIEDIEGLAAALQALQDQITALSTGKADASHTHPISQITGLQTALDGKSDKGHRHTQADIDGPIDATTINGRMLYVQATNPTNPKAGDILLRKNVG